MYFTLRMDSLGENGGQWRGIATEDKAVGSILGWLMEGDLFASVAVSRTDLRSQMSR